LPVGIVEVAVIVVWLVILVLTNAIVMIAGATIAIVIFVRIIDGSDSSCVPSGLPGIPEG
jgi:hypothetical protein